MDETKIAENRYRHQVRAECPICGAPVGIYVIWRQVGGIDYPVLYTVIHLPAKPEARSVATRYCRGSTIRPEKFINIPCPECRRVGMHGNVPMDGRASKNGLCCKHDRMKNGPLPKE